MNKYIRSFKLILLLLCIGLLGYAGYRGYHYYQKTVREMKMLKAIIQRLEADSRIAEVLVTDVTYNPITQKHMTTIKFLEFDSAGQPMEPKYFTFNGNIIQFQSLVVRFKDAYVKAGDALRGKSIYLFWKVFILDGNKTQEYEISKINEVPSGYRVDSVPDAFEGEIWKTFWRLALDAQEALSKGIKNAQIEAPGTKFVPGMLYTLKIEHDGGIRIDVQEIPAILKGERIHK